MRKLLLLMFLALFFVTDIDAQRNVKIVTKDATTSINLDRIESIEIIETEWTPWEQIGTGTYTFYVYWSGAHSDLPIYYREHRQNVNDAQFFIPGIAGSMDLTIEYNKETGACQVLPQYALTNDNYGQVTVSDIPHYPLASGYTYEQFPCTYNAEKGLFSLNLVYFVSTDYNANTNGRFGNGVETFQLDGFKQYDYSFSMEYTDKFADNNGNNFAVISTTKGADVSQYMLTVIGENEDLNTTVSGMIDGTAECETYIESQTIYFPITQSGNYTAVAVTFDENYNTLETYTTNFEFDIAGGNSWVSLGMATYTDDAILPLFGNQPMTYQVEVLENKEQPGLFRMVDPYGPNFPLYPYASSYKEGSYIEIDATDPECVWIEGIQSTGLDVQNNGLMSITSMAWYQVSNTEGATKEDAKEGGLCGIYSNGIITFPVDGIVTIVGDRAYYGNRNGAFKLDMSNMTPVENSAPARKAPVNRNAVKKLQLNSNAAKVTLKNKKERVAPLTIKSAAEAGTGLIVEE